MRHLVRMAQIVVGGSLLLFLVVIFLPLVVGILLLRDTDEPDDNDSGMA